MLYVKQHRVTLLGASHGIYLTEPLRVMGMCVGDHVKVEINDDKVMTIKKVK